MNGNCMISGLAGKTPKKVDNKVHSQHLLFVVCYVTFRAAYSLAVTFTVLLLLIRFVNRLEDVISCLNSLTLLKVFCQKVNEKHRNN